ncbi:MAG: hypothetical protein Q9204_006922 [Flavoplaca sp. TL-2023a]
MPYDPPLHHPLGRSCPSTRLSYHQAKQAGWPGPQYNSALDLHGIGRHHGKLCPHRKIFDSEFNTPGTEIHTEAQGRGGGICADELWLIINNHRRRASFQDGNEGYGITAPNKWDYVMDRIFNAAPWEESCGPYGLLPEGADFEGKSGSLTVVQAALNRGVKLGMGWVNWGIVPDFWGR